MADAWDELKFDFEAAVETALPPSANASAGDFRFRTQVCRHWLRGLCMKGDSCEFLHKMDRKRMPLCRWRTDCQVEGCAFRHEEEQEAPECAMYQQGFCRAGPKCRFRHVKLAREDCPEFADFSLVNPTSLSGGAGGGRAGGGGGGGGYNSNYGGGGGARGGGGSGGDYAVGDARKSILCKNWMNTKTCAYGDNCNYAHGEEELRASTGGGGSFGGRFGARKDPFVDPEVEKAVPVKAGDRARFFVLRSMNHDNLAVSAIQKKWYARRNNITTFNNAFDQPGKVIFFFSVNLSSHFQGCALMTSRAPELDNRMHPELATEFSMEWLRLVELRHGATAQIENPLNEKLPVFRSRDGQEVEYEAGRKLLKLMWTAPEITLPDHIVEKASKSQFSDVRVYRKPPPPAELQQQPKAPPPVNNKSDVFKNNNNHSNNHNHNHNNNGNNKNNNYDDSMSGSAHGPGQGSPNFGPGAAGGHAEASGMMEGVANRGAGAGSLNIGSLPSPQQYEQYEQYEQQHQPYEQQQKSPVGPPGFLFEIESQHFNECVGKLLFGLPPRLPPGAQDTIKPGNPMFLWDHGNGLVLGIFRAVSGLTEMLDRSAWAMPGMDSPLPWQVRVAVEVEAPSIKAGDPALLDIFEGGVVMPGALTPQQADALASVMTSRVVPPPVSGAAPMAMPSQLPPSQGPGVRPPGGGFGFHDGGGRGGHFKSRQGRKWRGKAWKK